MTSDPRADIVAAVTTLPRLAGGQTGTERIAGGGVVWLKND
ncbi:MAG: hypothetical protein ABR534_03980 [Desulfotignum sp.]